MSDELQEKQLTEHKQAKQRVSDSPLKKLMDRSNTTAALTGELTVSVGDQQEMRGT